MEIPLLVLQTAVMLKKTATDRFREFELSPAQFNVLNLLSDQPEGMRASDLAASLVVDPSNVTGLLKRLSADGLVEDVDSPEDGRSRIVRLTTRGRARWQKAHAVYTAGLKRLGAVLTASERAAMEKGLNKILQQCDELLG